MAPKASGGLPSGFSRSSTAIMASITSLESYLVSIREDYLLTASKALNETRKRQIETEMRLELHKLHNQIVHFESIFTTKSTTTSSGHLIRNLWTFGDFGEYQDVAEATTREFTANVVKILQLKLKSVLDSWTEMYDKRQLRIKELGKSRLDTSNMLPVTASEPTAEYSALQLDEPMQLQLQEEQHSLLETLKKSTLTQVTQIESSMMDITSLVRDINLQLSVQNDVIRDLDSQQVEISSNVQMGNKDLLKANSKSQRANGLIFWCILSASFFLLFIDWLL